MHRLRCSGIFCNVCVALVVTISYPFQTDDKPVLLACIKAFHKVFSHFIASGELFLGFPDGVSDAGKV